MHAGCCTEFEADGATMRHNHRHRHPGPLRLQHHSCTTFITACISVDPGILISLINFARILFILYYPPFFCHERAADGQQKGERRCATRATRQDCFMPVHPSLHATLHARYRLVNDEGRGISRCMSMSRAHQPALGTALVGERRGMFGLHRGGLALQPALASSQAWDQVSPYFDVAQTNRQAVVHGSFGSTTRWAQLCNVIGFRQGLRDKSKVSQWCHATQRAACLCHDRHLSRVVLQLVRMEIIEPGFESHHVRYGCYVAKVIVAPCLVDLIRSGLPILNIQVRCNLSPPTWGVVPSDVSDGRDNQDCPHPKACPFKANEFSTETPQGTSQACSQLRQPTVPDKYETLTPTRDGSQHGFLDRRCLLN
ncbi:hypothetical protein CCM_00195 [Cordyceps militaris CM01]|uniref:Uncharacterized protein n=1 Tax=Cordyceps militaris (strain CM01) TaxID=983644 RepID=G3J2K5_CORMM|nr:uncharacterized protein CCM_00195 [Cordyceps militaris CM01]EGX95541.1 hypothetical protein CCM_00195 [Cordyceps militaris CM01]